MTEQKRFTTRNIFHSWWPLALSWLFMGIEVPMVSAVMARLADPKIHLAAYGGVVFPVSLIVEAPIIMLLAASTSLSKDWASYQKLNRFMMWAGGLLTLLHILLAFTPLFDLVIVNLMQPPPEIIEPARIGLQIMTPWTWTIAYRRFQQGVLIRFGHSRAITIGTAIRIITNGGVLAIGYALGLPGIVTATMGISAGVTAEAMFAGWSVRPVLARKLKLAPAVQPLLTWSTFLVFYTPLALTSLLNLVVTPLGSAAISRMPQALESLALWPVISGFLFLFRSLGFAINEVVIAVMDQYGAHRSLMRFSRNLAIGISVVFLLVAATPLSTLWFRGFAGLGEDLIPMAVTSLWLGALWPVFSVYQNLYQGIIVYGKNTRGITESVVVLLVVTVLILVIGAMMNKFPGLYIGLVAFTASALAQIGWLWYRSRPVLKSL